MLVEEQRDLFESVLGFRRRIVPVILRVRAPGRISLVPEAYRFARVLTSRTKLLQVRSGRAMQDGVCRRHRIRSWYLPFNGRFLFGSFVQSPSGIQ
jgi:hypothetical protein